VELQEPRVTMEADLAASVRAALTGAGPVREVKMFGGLGFMLSGNLIAGASRRGLLVRVGSAAQSAALARPGARPMVMRGRTMPGYVYVDPPALDPASVAAWIALAISHVRTLPAKPTARRPARGTHRAVTGSRRRATRKPRSARRPK
jgi:TfoX/Sxy family transcriptional regulator of competence genes